MPHLLIASRLAFFVEVVENQMLGAVHRGHDVGPDLARLVDVDRAGGHHGFGLRLQGLDPFAVDREAVPADGRHHAGQGGVVVARLGTAEVLVQRPRINDVVGGVLAGVGAGRPVVDELANHARPGVLRDLLARLLRRFRWPSPSRDSTRPGPWAHSPTRRAAMPAAAPRRCSGTWA